MHDPLHAKNSGRIIIKTAWQSNVFFLIKSVQQMHDRY